MKLPETAREIFEARLNDLLQPLDWDDGVLVNWRQINPGTREAAIEFRAGQFPGAEYWILGEIKDGVRSFSGGYSADSGSLTIRNLVQIVQQKRTWIVEQTIQQLEYFADQLLPVLNARGRNKGVAAATLAREELYHRWPWCPCYGNQAIALNIARAWGDAGIDATPQFPHLVLWQQEPPDISLQELQARLKPSWVDMEDDFTLTSWDRYIGKGDFVSRARALGWLLHFEKEVRSGQAVSRRVIAPTNRTNRELLQHWDAKDTPEDLEIWREHLNTPVEKVSLRGPGNVQLSLNLGPGFNFDQEILNNIEALVKVQGGLNTYLALLYAAGNHGRRGEFNFNMADHLRAIGKENRQKWRDAETRKIELMSKIVVEVDFGYHTNPKTKKAEPLTWEEPLLTIPGGLYSGKGGARTLEGAVIRLSPELYKPVRERRGKLGSNWSQMSAGVLRLDTRPGQVGALARYIAIEFLFAKRHNLTPGGYWQTTGGYLLRTAHLVPRYRENRLLAWQALRSALETLSNITPPEFKTWRAVDGAGDLLPPEHWTKETLFHIWPADWFIDSIQHKAPLLEGGHATRPNTGREFKAWRERNGLTVTAAAREIGVIRSTIILAEKDPDGPVSGKIRAGILARWERLHSKTDMSAAP